MGKVSYYHDRHGLKADCVLHLENNDYALFEFKIGNAHVDDDAKQLLKLKKIIEEKIDEDNLNIKAPKFSAIITVTKFAYAREDGVKVLPIACLRN